MDVLTLMSEARRLGFQLHMEGSQLVITGPRAHEAIALQLKNHKPEVMAIVSVHDEEVMWRVTAMTPQIPARGRIPPLRARPFTATPGTSSQCGSCGDPLTQSRRYRCLPCQHASWLVLMQPRE